MQLTFSKSKVFIPVLLFSTTISLKLFLTTVGWYNILFIIVAISVIFVNLKAFTKLNSRTKQIYFFLFSFTFATLLHISTFRVVTFLNTCFYTFTFLSLLEMLNSGEFKIEFYIKVIRILIYLFFYTLIIQQIMFFLGIDPVFNELGTDGLRLNSLSLEPSLTGIIVNVLFISYVRTVEVINKKSFTLTSIFDGHKFLSFAFAYIILTCGSSYGILLFGIVFLYLIRSFFTLKRMIMTISIILALVGILLILDFQYEFLPLIRLIDLAQSIFTLDRDVILLTDLSAGIRIIPVFWFFDNFSLISLNFWFGEGMGFSGVQLAEFLNTGSDFINGWFFPTFINDNGMICFIILLYVLIKNSIYKVISVETAILAISLLNTSLNTTTFWVVIYFFTINKYFSVNKSVE